MLKPYTWNEDGSVTLDPSFVPTPGFLKNFININGQWFPNYQTCRHRKIEKKRLECGRLQLRFACTLLNETCSVESCKQCKVEPK